MSPTMQSNLRDHKAPTGAAEAAWEAVLRLRRAARAGHLSLPVDIDIAGIPHHIAANGSWRAEVASGPGAAELLDLYLPLALVPARQSFVLAHLAQSLDGRIATVEGASQWLTGSEDLCHTHRLRALADAVIVGAATVRNDDPRLTVRRCSGDQPVRVVLDTNLTLSADRQLFQESAVPTLVLAAADRVGDAKRLGAAEIVPVPREGERLPPQAVRAVLARRGLHWLFIEGGGVTVSRFLAAGVLDRLQIALAPVILGSGRPSLQLQEIGDLAEAIRPQTRRFTLGNDVLIECKLRE
ncbi:MAG TPA: RibD family protein [Stellaceae bacterium]|nr:RibD family protein [Stellaceae bacterium]